MKALTYDALQAALAGKHGRVVQLSHPWLICLAQNFNGRAALTVKVTLEPGQIISDGRGYSISTDRNGDECYVRVASEEAGIPMLFLKMVDYILERTALAGSSEEASKFFVDSIHEFRQFTMRKPGRLNEEQIRGLLAELLFLHELLSNRSAETLDIFRSWGGPFGATHDFEFPHGNSIEVKSSHRPATEIRVSSPEQIQFVSEGLDLVVLPLERVVPGSDTGINLVNLVETISVVASKHSPEVQNLWENALVSLGFELSDEYYQQWEFTCGQWLRFEVSDDFPIIPSSLIPEGIMKVSYSLRLDKLEAYKADFVELISLTW